MAEHWERLEEPFNHYEVSDLAHWRDYETKQKPEKIRYWKDKYGYNMVTLYRKGIGSLRKREKIFNQTRLILKHFKPNPLNLPTVNHINNIRDDDRVENLEWATRRQQNIHQKARGKSGLKGVCQRGNKWESSFKNLDTEKHEYLGRFDTKQEAGREWDRRAREFYSGTQEEKQIIYNFGIIINNH
jgi:hypothetical protein